MMLAGQSRFCAGCRHESDKHSCENFPLPSWATGYLAKFDQHLKGAPYQSITTLTETGRKIYHREAAA